MRVVDRGVAEHGVRWTLTAGGDGDSYSTMLRVEDDAGVIDSGGMGGPKLWGNDRLNICTGGNPNRGLRGVVVRSALAIERLLLVLEDGTSTDITACGGEVIDDMRFGVSLVPPDSRLLEVVGLAGDGALIERFELHGHDDYWPRNS